METDKSNTDGSYQYYKDPNCPKINLQIQSDCSQISNGTFCEPGQMGSKIPMETENQIMAKTVLKKEKKYTWKRQL